MLALLVALALSQVPSPPTGWTRAEVEARFGPPSFAGPLEAPWEPGSMVASYVHQPEALDGICRVHLGTVRGAVWVAMVYYTPGAVLVSAHCLRLDDLDVGYDVTPDVLRRLMGGGT